MTLLRLISIGVALPPTLPSDFERNLSVEMMTGNELSGYYSSKIAAFLGNDYDQK